MDQLIVGRGWCPVIEIVQEQDHKKNTTFEQLIFKGLKKPQTGLIFSDPAMLQFLFIFCNYIQYIYCTVNGPKFDNVT